MQHPSVFEHLLSIKAERGTGFIVLIDPDKLAPDGLPRLVEACVSVGVDALFVGGSLLHTVELESYLQHLKALSPLPVIGFPGSLQQISPTLDAILYLSVISGRNPDYLFGRHVMASSFAQTTEPGNHLYRLHAGRVGADYDGAVHEQFDSTSPA